METPLPSDSLKHPLTEDEKKWVARFDILKDRGYVLRPRYRPGWVPSYNDSDIGGIMRAEDAILQNKNSLLDAQRIEDNVPVFLKLVRLGARELEVAQYLNQEELRKDATNHTIPLLDVIKLENAELGWAVMVFPLLRRADSPYFMSVRECLDFVGQSLEGLVFMHKHNIAHRDCNWENILMDARGMFPKGWHPQSLQHFPDGRFLWDTPSRTAAGGVQYYYIDFGLSTQKVGYTIGADGQVRPPELSDTVPYNPYRSDVWMLGTGYGWLLFKRHHYLDFLKPLTERMTATDPAQRPTAQEAYDEFRKIRSNLSEWQLSQRISRGKESSAMRSIKDAVYRLQDFYWTRTAKNTLPPLL